jgi:hypothetical protein
VLWLGSGLKSSYYTHTHTHTHAHTHQHFTNNFSVHITPFHTWLTLKNFLFIRGIWQYRTAGCLKTGCWAVLLYTPIADCLLRNDYSVQLIMQLEQVVTQWNAVSLQLFYGSTIYRPVCLFLYRIIHKSLRDVQPLQYSSRDGHAEGEHVNRGRDTPSFCPTLQVFDMSFLLCLSWLLHGQVLSSGGTYELPCISVFAFITRVECAYEAFQFQYKLWEAHGITG